MLQQPPLPDLPPSMALWAFGLLQFITVVGVGWVVKTVYRLDKNHVQLSGRLDVFKVMLTGETGDNGLKSEVKSLRTRMHNAENEIHGLKGEDALFRQRLDSAGF